VLRRIAPPDTLGGGVVLDPRPRRHGPSRDLLVRLERLARGEAPEPTGRMIGTHPPTPAAPRTPSEARVGGVRIKQPAPLSPSATTLEQRLRDAAVEPPIDSELDARDLAALRDAGRAVRVSKSLHYHVDALADIRERLIALAGRNGGTVTLAQLRDELGTSRKFAQALLEHFDSEKVTIRRGDEHVLRRRAG
jgi:selenocysteine-specific elongation factor